MRLRNKHNGTQINVPAAKAARLINEGIYQAVPDDEQPPEPVVPKQNPRTTGRGDGSIRGATSIAQALSETVGPTWNVQLG